MRTVIAASRCSSRLTVSEPSVLAPELRWEGSVAPSWAELRGDVVLRVEVLELLVVVGPALEVVDVARQLRGQPLDVVDDRRKDVQDQKDEEREGGEVHDQDRQHPRHRAVSRPGPLDQPDGGVERRASRKTAAATHCSVVLVCRSAIAKRTATPAQNERHQHDLGDRPRWIWSARIAVKLVSAPDPTIPRPAGIAALLSVDFDDAPARQPGASPSPPPPGGIALGGARAANSRTGHRKL